MLNQCETDVFPHDYRGLYGNWTIECLIAGQSGGIMPEFDLLSIRKDLDFYIYRNNTIILKGKINIVKVKYDYLETEFISKKDYIGSFSKKVIRLHNETLSISDNVCDGYSAVFIRSED